MPPIGSIRRVVAEARNAFDQSRHPARRDRARARLAELDPDAVVFVCLGNICRSPYAERLLSEAEPLGLRIESAGFIGPGRPPPEAAQRVASARGVSHADHRSKLLADTDFGPKTALISFDRFNRQRLRTAPGVVMARTFWLADFDPITPERRAIPDPWGKEDTEFEAVFERIERCVSALHGELSEIRS